MEATIVNSPMSTKDSPHPGSRTGELLVFSAPIAYSTAWEFQSRLHRERLLGLRPDTVAILEHQPVYTLGRSTQSSDWLGNEELLREQGADLVRVNRGGSITFHGPGQIVVYPILKTADYAAGPRRLVWLLEEVLITLLARWNIAGQRIERKPGVWVLSPHPSKIASIGIRIERGISLHGFALNVDMDLAPFHFIRPCGLSDCVMTSMKNLITTGLSVEEVRLDLARIFGEVFEVEWTTGTEIPFTPIAAAHDLLRDGAYHI